jgi:hypothetical protein
VCVLPGLAVKRRHRSQLADCTTVSECPNREVDVASCFLPCALVLLRAWYISVLFALHFRADCCCSCALISCAKEEEKQAWAEWRADAAGPTWTQQAALGRRIALTSCSKLPQAPSKLTIEAPISEAQHHHNTTATMGQEGADPRMMNIQPRIRYNTIGGVNGPLVVLENVGAGSSAALSFGRVGARR